MSKKVKSCTGRKGKSLQNHHQDFTSHLIMDPQTSVLHRRGGATWQPDAGVFNA